MSGDGGTKNPWSDDVEWRPLHDRVKMRTQLRSIWRVFVVAALLIGFALGIRMASTGGSIVPALIASSCLLLLGLVVDKLGRRHLMRLERVEYSVEGLRIVETQSEPEVTVGWDEISTVTTSGRVMHVKGPRGDVPVFLGAVTEADRSLPLLRAHLERFTS